MCNTPCQHVQYMVLVKIYSEATRHIVRHPPLVEAPPLGAGEVASSSFTDEARPKYSVCINSDLNNLSTYWATKKKKLQVEEHINGYDIYNI